MTYICLDIALEHVHVPLFILIAGYLCHKQDIRSFYLKKVKRILIPFIFMSCLKLLYSNLISSDYIHGDSIPEQLFDTFICGRTYWFCYCLLVIFILAPLFWNSRRRMWTALAVLTAANLLIRWFDLSFTNILQIDQVIQQMPFFLAGMLIWSYKLPEQIKKKRSLQYLLLAASACCAVLCGYIRFGLDFYSIWLTDVLFGISVMYILYFIAAGIRGKAADFVLGSMGRYSLQIMFFDSLLRILLFKLVYLALQPGLAAVLIVTIMDVSVSCLLCPVIKRIPVLSKLTGLA